MDIAPTPQGQIHMPERMGDELEYESSDDMIARYAIYYNSYADVAGYGLPHIDAFANKRAARAALSRLLARLHELFDTPKAA